MGHESRLPKEFGEHNKPEEPGPGPVCGNCPHFARATHPSPVLDEAGAPEVDPENGNLVYVSEPAEYGDCRAKPPDLGGFPTVQLAHWCGMHPDRITAVQLMLAQNRAAVAQQLAREASPIVDPRRMPRM